jgi:hypothetical protein
MFYPVSTLIENIQTDPNIRLVGVESGQTKRDRIITVKYKDQQVNVESTGLQNYQQFIDKLETLVVNN